LKEHSLTIAMLSIHSSPVGELGKKDTGGMSVYVRELARALGKRGHRIDIFTRLQDPAWKPQVQLYENVRLIHLRAGRKGHLSTLALYPYLKEFFLELERFRATESIRYDLIHSHYWLSGQVGIWLQDRLMIPHMFMFHTLGVLKNITDKDEQESELRIATEKGLVQKCQRILATTEREKDHLMRYYGADPKRIGVVPCGVNLDLFCPMDKRTARRQVGFSIDESIVLYVGRLAKIKGTERLLQAMTHLKYSKRTRLVIIGGDGLQTRESRNLLRLTQRLGLQDDVEFLGRVDHEMLPPYYSAADVMVLPSHYETFGLVALEALASGTPVVATRVGAMETILREGETGYVVANDGPELLAAGIEKLLERSRAGALSTDAIRASVFRFGWDAVVSAVIDQYSILLQRSHSTRSCLSGTHEISKSETLDQDGCHSCACGGSE
jgi:D-inositol-3-phosphate glycosyltransferase